MLEYVVQNLVNKLVTLTLRLGNGNRPITPAPCSCLLLEIALATTSSSSCLLLALALATTSSRYPFSWSCAFLVDVAVSLVRGHCRCPSDPRQASVAACCRGRRRRGPRGAATGSLRRGRTYTGEGGDSSPRPHRTSGTAVGGRRGRGARACRSGRGRRQSGCLFCVKEQCRV